MEKKPNIPFEDTSVAFSYKPTPALRKANFIFTLVNNPWVSAIAVSLVKMGLKMRLPIEGLIKYTVFDHFCGGVDISDTDHTVAKLAEYSVGAILDYSVEGENSEAEFERTKQEIIRTISKARDSEDIPFCVFKMTGVADINVLERIQSRASLTLDEQEAYSRITKRVDEICSKAHEAGVPILIDAEESWIIEEADGVPENIKSA